MAWRLRQENDCGPTATHDWKTETHMLLFAIHIYIYIYMGVSINAGSPKMVGLEWWNPIKVDDLGVPSFNETSIYAYIIDNRNLHRLIWLWWCNCLYKIRYISEGGGTTQEKHVLNCRCEWTLDSLKRLEQVLCSPIQSYLSLRYD